MSSVLHVPNNYESILNYNISSNIISSELSSIKTLESTVIQPNSMSILNNTRKLLRLSNKLYNEVGYIRPSILQNWQKDDIYNSTEVGYLSTGAKPFIIKVTKQNSINFSWVIELDIIYYVCELILVICFLYALNFKKLAARYNLTLQSLSQSNISIYETIAVISIFFGLLIFDAVIVLTEDDLVDSAILGILMFVIITLTLTMCSVNIYFLYALTPISGGEVLKRLTINDFVNVCSCILRIFSCWVRYVIYDIQVESVDLALMYTEDIDISLSKISLLNVLWLILIVQLDIIFVSVQILLSLFKLGIASFLLWLIVDLFILRQVSTTVSIWFMYRKES